MPPTRNDRRRRNAPQLPVAPSRGMTTSTALSRRLGTGYQSPEDPAPSSTDEADELNQSEDAEGQERRGEGRPEPVAGGASGSDDDYGSDSDTEHSSEDEDSDASNGQGVVKQYWQVEAIAGARRNKRDPVGIWEYLLVWADFERKDDSWEPVESFKGTSCNKLVNRFWDGIEGYAALPFWTRRGRKSPQWIKAQKANPAPTNAVREYARSLVIAAPAVVVDREKRRFAARRVARKSRKPRMIIDL